VARFDLIDQKDPGTQEEDPDSTVEGSAGDEPAAGTDSGQRVAWLDGLDPATAGRARVADFGTLAADTGRPIAPVIRLDSVSRRDRGADRLPDDSVPPSAGRPVVDGDAPARERGRDPERRRARSSGRRTGAIPGRDVRAADGDASYNASRDGVVARPVPRDGYAAGPMSRDEAATARRPAGSADDGAPPDDDIPPDGPLPRGRRKRARAGRLGPDAPDPELPLPEADPVAIAREICLRLLTDRARTRQELAQALARKGVPDEAAAAVLDRFADVGLVDDAAFAGQWVHSRHTYRGLGRRAIAVELRRKGVADRVAKEALAEVDPESEDRRARELVDRKLRSMVVDTPEQRAKAAQRLVGMLARKGYGAGTAYRVVREALAEHGAGSDEFGAEVHDE
jgi:regulatory protein